MMTEIESECLRRIAEAKSIPVETIGLGTDLSSIGVDSLDRVSLSFDLEEQYGVEIPESRLHQIRNIGDVAAAVEEAVLKKGIKPAEPSALA